MLQERESDDEEKYYQYTVDFQKRYNLVTTKANEILMQSEVGDRLLSTTKSNGSADER